MRIHLPKRRWVRAVVGVGAGLFVALVVVCSHCG